MPMMTNKGVYMKQVKINKALVWRNSYGRPFVLRRRLSKIRCASVYAVASSQVSTINSSFAVGGAVKAKAIAEVYISANEAILNILKEANKGFVKK
jgi:hypothetical protein